MNQIHDPAYKHLLSPGKIGSLELKNRIVMAPMGDNFAEADGHCSERIQAFYEARAKGGAGLITMGVGAIAYPMGTAEPYQVGISDDKFIPGLKHLTDRVHRHGARIAIQLQHAGKTAARDMAEGRELWVPSIPPQSQSDMFNSLTRAELGAFIRPKGGQVKIRVMDKADIQQMIIWFAEAAERAKKAGFDGVELHAAHSYIIAGFLSPYYNMRDDEYGGSYENRSRLLREVIAAVRDKVGRDYPVWLRLDAYELRVETGITLDECIKTAKLAQECGLDAVSVSAYANPDSGAAFTQAPLVNRPAGFLDWATEVAKNISIPVTAVGRIEPEVADKAIAEGNISFLAMGRKLLADPDLPNKLSENRADDIRPCIYCYVCVSQIFINERVKCAVNPMTGNESEYPVELTNAPKHLLIIGGGPGGMEAAAIAARRGHKVTLVEKSARLGGTLFFASMAYPENGKLLEQQIKQLDHPNIQVRLNTQADKALIEELNPDEVIVATGASRGKPDIPGADGKHVWSGDELRKIMTGEGKEIARQKLSMVQRAMLSSGQITGVTGSIEATRKLSNIWMPLGNKVTIIGGGLVGLELAEFLAQRGRSVTVLEPDHDLGAELSIVRRWRVLHELNKLEVTLVKKAQIEAIDADHVHYQVKTKSEHPDLGLEANLISHALPTDSVVLASGAAPDTRLADTLSAAGVTVHLVGDCQQLGYIEGAIHSAARIARKI
ncbi:NAD(P)/FAD-dependent oxidoreductase [Shewanella submarina]|uniref:FAD-dependent oxidoreductase n=1 Tax=Shewanella submarina TaxID=2016376 RepID=A0ABV7GDU7_9GAMM|nr:FAD-dependent oxidoreductase [Shewanella submarina]MCL1037960.1 NAD(P)/FAD-dependent oxidoreductase [Shewanella submarina]